MQLCYDAHTKNKEVLLMVKGLVSVIIPVYNARKYLDSCIDSLLGQSYTQLEIILVNDGSRDDSLALCRARARQDARIMVIDQPNAGPGAARNAGLAIAKGEYVLFSDSDDIVLPGAVEHMVEAMWDDRDLAIALFELCADGKRKSVRGLIKEDLLLDRNEFLERLSRWPGAYYYSALWNKLYRHEIIKKHHISFHTNMIWGEDCLFNMEYNCHVQKVRCVNMVVYRYNRKISGLAWNSLFQLHKGIRIKHSIYRALKRIYKLDGQYKKYYWRIQRYILNVTLMD